MTINNYFENSQLSYATYADLEAGMSMQTYLGRLVAAGVNMSESQATQFASRYTVINQQPNDSFGFSATLFWDWEQAKYTMAIRGTEFGDFQNDVVLADLADIGFKGIAARQAVSLFNYYQRLITPMGEQAYQLELKLDNLSTPPDELYTILVDGVPDVSDPYYMYIKDATSTADGLGLLSSGDQLNIAGHSLGGHLSMIMGRMFSSSVDQVYTYNAPGFDSILSTQETGWFFDAIDEAQYRNTGMSTVASDFPVSSYNHFVAPDDIISKPIVGTVPGTQIQHYVEAEGFKESHKIVYVTDALATYSLLANLDANASMTLPELTPILEAASSKSTLSLEGIVNAMGELFGATTKVELENRDQLYQAIDEIQNSALYQSYKGTASVVYAEGISVEAVGSLAYRFAVVNLNPFVIVADDALYASFETELALYDPLFQTGTLTGNYIEDKSWFLNQLFDYNRFDDDNSVVPNSTQYFYK